MGRFRPINFFALWTTVAIGFLKIGEKLMPKYEDLYEILPDIDIDFDNYWKCEQEVITPALMQKGFSEIEWYMGERDSFGPLSRYTKCYDKDGNERRFVYG